MTENETPVKKPPTRRLWRHFYRRFRLYIPIVVVLLFIMVLYLPITSGWLTGIVERRLTETTGLPVTIERVRLQLASGVFEAGGVEIAPADGGEPFRIDRIRLEGPFAELMAGEGRWPQRVLVANPSELRLARTAKGFEPRGALDTLLARISDISTVEAAHAGEPKGLESLLGGPTPRVEFRNVRLAAESEESGIPPVKLALTRFYFPERTGADSPVIANFEGTATIQSPESIRGSLHMIPGDRSFSANAEVQGIQGHIDIPEYGTVYLGGDNIEFDVAVSEREDETVFLDLGIDAAHFETREERLGGLYWVDDRLRFHLACRTDPKSQTIQSLRARLIGDQIDLSLEGNASLTQNLPLEARLRAKRLPAALTGLAQREAGRAGIGLNARTTDTVHLDLSVAGPLLRPSEMDYHGSVLLQDLGVDWPGLADVVWVDRAQGTLSGNALTLDEIAARYGTLSLEGNATLPIPDRAGESETGQATLFITGNPRPLLVLAKSKGWMTNEITDIDLPLSIEATAELLVTREQGVPPRSFSVEPLGYSGQAVWRNGQVTMRDLPYPVRVSSAKASFSPGSATLTNLRMNYQNVILNLDASLSPRDGNWVNSPDCQLRVSADGPIPRIVEMIHQFAPLPVAPNIAGGRVSIDGTAAGQIGKWNSITYDTNVTLENVSANVEIPHDLPFDQLYARINATNERVTIERFSAQVGERAHASGSGVLTDEGLTLNVEAASSLKIAESIAPRDVADLVFEGNATTSGVVRLTPTFPLPEGEDIIRRWALALAGPEPFHIDRQPGAPIVFSINADIFPGENAAVFHREMPHRIDDIRGRVQATAFGFEFEDVSLKLGESRNVKVDARIQLETRREPTRIDLVIHAPELDLNDWLNGWGQAEWAEPVYMGPRRPRSPDPKLLTVIRGNVQFDKTRFLTARATDANMDFEFQAWRNRDNEAKVTLNESTLYGGSAMGRAHLVLPRDESTSFSTQLDFAGVGLKGFLDDLLEKDQPHGGLATGTAWLTGTIGDYGDWVGEGEYEVVESQFIGKHALKTLSNFIQLGDMETQSATRISGKAALFDNSVSFPDMVIENNNIRLVVIGSIRILTGDLDFFMTMEILTNRLGDVPLISNVFEYLNAIKNTLFAFRVRGTVGNPKVEPSALNLESLPGIGRGIGAGSQVLDATRSELLKGFRQSTTPVEKGIRQLRDAVPPVLSPEKSESKARSGTQDGDAP